MQGIIIEGKTSVSVDNDNLISVVACGNRFHIVAANYPCIDVGGLGTIQNRVGYRYALCYINGDPLYLAQNCAVIYRDAARLVARNRPVILYRKIDNRSSIVREYRTVLSECNIGAYRYLMVLTVKGKRWVKGSRFGAYRNIFSLRQSNIAAKRIFAAKYLNSDIVRVRECLELATRIESASCHRVGAYACQPCIRGIYEFARALLIANILKQNFRGTVHVLEHSNLAVLIKARIEYDIARSNYLGNLCAVAYRDSCGVCHIIYYRNLRIERGIVVVYPNIAYVVLIRTVVLMYGDCRIRNHCRLNVD